jgi:hypothetical protein
MSLVRRPLAFLSWSSLTFEYRGQSARSVGTEKQHPGGHPANRHKRTIWVVSALLFVLAHTTNGLAEPFDPADQGWEGTSGFVTLAREVFGAQRVSITRQLAWDRLEPTDALIVIHPTRPLDFDQASAFLDSGGRLALLDDHGRGAALLTRFRIHRKSAPSDPEVVLRDNPQLAIAVPAGELDDKPRQPTAGRHPIVADVDQVVTNHPTVLWPDPKVELTPLLELPRRQGPGALIALLGVIGDAARCEPKQEPSTQRCGRLLALSDPSVFINQMLRYPGNRAFATGLLEYLAQDDTTIGGKLHIVINDFAQSGAPQGLGQKDWLEKRLNALRELVDEVRTKGLPESATTPLTALLCLVIAALGWQSLSRSVLRRPGFTHSTALVAMGGPVGRAAVLAAPTTHPALVVIELKTALEESLRHQLQLEPTASSTAILQAVQQTRLLDARGSAKLEQMFAEMNRAESSLHRQSRFRARPADIERLRQDVFDLLAILERNGNARVVPEHTGSRYTR